MKKLALTALALALALALAGCSLLESPEKQALKQMIQQYEMVKKSGSAMERCTYAGLVVAGAVQANDDAAHTKWKDVEREECAAAGVPR